jgi:hypothetical protein
MIEPERLAWAEPGTGMTATQAFVNIGDVRMRVRIGQPGAPEAFRDR